VKSTGFDI